MRIVIGGLLASLAATSASAADLAVSVRNAQGRPVADAVVTLYPNAGTGGGAIRFDWPYRMAQQNLKFDPFVLIVPAGAVVSFPNRDAVRHQVYSFSPTHPFELKLYGKDESRTVRFDKAGVVALGCNIHDSMVAFIKVVDTPFAAKSDAAGEASLTDAPAGAATLRIWHPYMKGGELVRAVVLPREGLTRQVVTLDLRPPPSPRTSY